MKSIIVFILGMVLVSCGGKKKENQITENLNPYPSSFENSQVPVENHRNEAQKPLQNEASDEFVYSLEQSGIDMDRVEKGEKVFIKCSTLPSVNMFNECRLGFNEMDLLVGNYHLEPSESMDLYHSVKQPALKSKMMKGYKLAIVCQKTCTLLKTVSE